MADVKTKEILGYEGLYSVDENGNIYSLRNNKILKGQKNSNGYLRVGLSKNGKVKLLFIHHIVADCFLDNKNQCINHKNGIKIDNRLENLEYTTFGENIQHAYDNGLNTAESYSKRVMQFDINGIFIKTHKSMLDAEKSTGINNSKICACCKGKRKTAGGYKWIYE